MNISKLYLKDFIMYYMSISFYYCDAYDMEEKHFKHIFSDSMEELEKIKKDIEDTFNKKNKQKSNKINIKINEVKIFNKKDISEIKKDMKNFFLFN